MLCQTWLLLRMARYGDSFCTALQLEASLKASNMIEHSATHQAAALKAYALLGSNKVQHALECHEKLVHCQYCLRSAYPPQETLDMSVGQLEYEPSQRPILVSVSWHACLQSTAMHSLRC